MRFNPLENLLETYIKSTSSLAPPYLNELERETWLKIPSPHMLTGFAQGRLLSFLSHLLFPQRILEIGTFTGYGSLCLAEGMAPGGKLFTLDSSPENVWLARKYFEISPFTDQITLILGPALESLKSLHEIWDIVYIDADKKNNRAYFEWCWPQVRKGGIILIDNVLAGGSVLKPMNEQKPNEKAVSDLNRWLPTLNEARVVMLPIRDGLTLVQKIT